MVPQQEVYFNCSSFHNFTHFFFGILFMLVVFGCLGILVLSQRLKHKLHAQIEFVLFIRSSADNKLKIFERT